MSTYNELLLQEATAVSDTSQTSAFESQICRCLSKEAGLQKASLLKYAAMFATVQADQVLPQLWDAMQLVLKDAKPASKK